MIQGIYLTQEGPRNGKTAKLWNSGAFASPPAKNTALPVTSPVASTTTGTSHGGDGQYRFSGVTTGQDYYVSIEDGATITYDSTSLVAAGSATGNVKNEGAIGDGTTDDTTAINTALANTAYGRVFFPPGTYLVTDITINGREGLVVEGEGATIKTSGTGSSASPQGLRIQGTTRDITIRNLRFLGDGVAANYHAGIWASSGDVEGLRIENCHFQSCAVGIWLSCSSGTWEQILVDHCEFESMVGTGTTQGLGVYYSNASSAYQFVAVRDCYFISTQQYAIQCANGRGFRAQANWIQSHRSSVATAAVVAAITVNGRHLEVLDNTFVTCYDGAVQVKPASATPAQSVTIRGNKVQSPGNAVPDFTLGTADPATDGSVDDLVVANNQVHKDGIAAACIDVFTARRAVISGNVFQMLSVGTANTPVIELEGAGEGAGTATYTDEVTLVANVGQAAVSGAGTVNGIRLESAFCTSGADVRFFGNSFAGAAANFQTVTTITNDNLIVQGMLTTGLTFDATSQGVELDSGPLDFNAGLRLTRREQATNFTITALETCIFAAGGAGGITLTLPAMLAAHDGLMLAIFKTDDTAGAVTINATGTDGLYGPATGTLNLSKAYDGVFLIADFNATKPFWRIVGQVGLKSGRTVTALTSASSPYTVLDSDDFIICDTTAGSITLNLPAQAGRKGWHYSVFKSAAGNNVVFDGSGAETVEGAATLTCPAGPGIIQIVQTGTNWAVVARNTANVA